MDGEEVKRYQFFYAIMLRAEVHAEDEEEAKRRVLEKVDLHVNVQVPMLWLQPLKDGPLLVES